MAAAPASGSLVALLLKSFLPVLGIVPLRFLMRHRAEIVGDAATRAGKRRSGTGGKAASRHNKAHGKSGVSRTYSPELAGSVLRDLLRRIVNR